MSNKAREVLLRPFTEEDLSCMVKWNNDDEVEQYVHSCLPKSLPECRVWYQENRKEWNYRIYAIEEAGGKIIGDLELDHISWKSREAELRIRIGEKDYWNKGYGSTAINLVLRHAFEELDLNRVYLRVYASNIRAIRCYLKNGFRKEASLRRVWDKDWKELLLMFITKEIFLQKHN